MIKANIESKSKYMVDISNTFMLGNKLPEIPFDKYPETVIVVRDGEDVIASSWLIEDSSNIAVMIWLNCSASLSWRDKKESYVTIFNTLRAERVGKMVLIHIHIKSIFRLALKYGKGVPCGSGDLMCLVF